jgi:hypothetical protein
MSDLRALLLRASVYCPSGLQEEIDAALAVTKRAKRLPDDWRPSPELMNWAIKERPDISCTAQVDAFRDYWMAKAGKDGAKLDWDATFRNWIRNCRTVYKTLPPERTPSPQQVAIVRRQMEPVNPKVLQMLDDVAAKLHFRG